jgi:hypothetical protein
VTDDKVHVQLSVSLPLSDVKEGMATNFFNLPQTLDQILSAVRGIQGTLLSHGATLTQLVQQGVKIMAAIDDLESKVAEVKGVEDSVVMLLDTIHKELVDALAAGDMTRVQAVVDQLEMQRQALADAVARNPDPGMMPQPGP